MKRQFSKFLAVVMALSLMLPLLSMQASAAESLPLPTLAAGYQHALAIMATDGTVRAWGWNAGDQLGTPHPDGVYSIASPVTVPNLSGVIAVAGGETYSLALKNDGTVWSWGQNYEGALGHGASTNLTTPTQVSGLTGVVSIAAGRNHALALKADGTVWAWGQGYYGQLGNEKYGNSSNSDVPIQVNGLSGVAAISANNFGNHSLALTNDGAVYSWGANESGQLGLGDTTFRTLPFLVPGLSGITKIAAGQYHTLAVDATGHVWAWGNNGGNYGNGGTASSTSPVQVPDTLLSNISDVAAGNAHSLFLKSDGTVLAAGLNDYGELGNGSTSFSAAPVSISGLTDVVSISAGREFSLALKSDKTVWAWGWNAAKQLGIDDPATMYSSTPVQVTLTDLSPGNVCEIGGTGYDDLDKALAAVDVSETATIKLLSDITYDKGILIAAAQHITFDLNGHNLSVITTATTGLEVSNGSVDYVGIGTFNVTGKSIGVTAKGSVASIKVTNATATDAGGIGAMAMGGGTVLVVGNATGGYMGASAAGSNSTITVGGNASGIADSTAIGANTINGGAVTVTGNASGVYKGAFARGVDSLVTVGGNALGTGENSFGASADDEGVVSVAGYVQAAQYATLATNTGRVTVAGSSIATRTENGWAAYADWDGEIEIGGNAVVQPASCGVYVTIRGKVTVDGEIINGGSDKAAKYIQILNASSGSSLYLTGAASDRTEPTTKDGYYTYSDGISTVWVKGIIFPITYPVTVNNGIASPAMALQDATITIIAAPAPNGQQFKEWSITPSVTFVEGTSATSSTAKFTMPAQVVTATATYEAIPAAVHSVTVNPSTVTVQKSTTYQFSATVNGTNNPSQSVAWSVYGNSSGGTSINSSGLLTVAADETSATLTVTATSTSDNSKSGIATVTVTAVAVTTYTVTFNSNGSVYAAKTVNVGESIGSAAWPADPTRSSYIFGGWFTGANGSGTQFTFATPVNAAMTVYAKWTYSGGSGGGGGTPSTPSTPNTPTYKADIKAGNNAETTIPVAVDKNAGTASIDAGLQNLARSGTVITVPSIPDVDTYSVGIPVPDLSTTVVQGTLTLDTNTGSVTVPSNMLTGATGISGSKAEISIGQGDKSTLPKDMQAAIGDKPLIQLTLSIDGKRIDWSNPNAPVAVSIPYSPTAAELTNPESIVVWYIDGSGNVVTIPNGQYDPRTGMVTFSTTHFSDYAVVHNKVSFNDVLASAWYNKAVSFIAARKITSGAGNGNYSPDAKLTRGEFIVLMMRAYGISPDANPTNNFSDAGSTYYTGYLAAAKRLKITSGVGNNMYAPDNQIARQEMFTLLYNALKVIGQLPQGDSGKKVLDFSDATQISDWAREAMETFVAAGTVGGSNGKLTPTGTTTRAEMAQMLYNLLGK